MNDAVGTSMDGGRNEVEDIGCSIGTLDDIGCNEVYITHGGLEMGTVGVKLATSGDLIRTLRGN